MLQSIYKRCYFPNQSWILDKSLKIKIPLKIDYFPLVREMCHKRELRDCKSPRLSRVDIRPHILLFWEFNLIAGLKTFFWALNLFTCLSCLKRIWAAGGGGGASPFHEMYFIKLYEAANVDCMCVSFCVCQCVCVRVSGKSSLSCLSADFT